MDNTDKRQFLDELGLLNKSKQYSSTFVKALKGSVILKKIEAILEDKRKVYNFAYVNLFKKYDVEHEDLYRDLDRIWTLCLNKKTSIEQKNDTTTLAAKAGGFVGGAAAAGAGIGIATDIGAISLAAALGIGAGFFSVAAGPFVLLYLGILEYRVRKLWNSYKTNCYLFAEEYVKHVKS